MRAHGKEDDSRSLRHTKGPVTNDPTFFFLLTMMKQRWFCSLPQAEEDVAFDCCNNRSRKPFIRIPDTSTTTGRALAYSRMLALQPELASRGIYKSRSQIERLDYNKKYDIWNVFAQLTILFIEEASDDLEDSVDLDLEATVQSLLEDVLDS